MTWSPVTESNRRPSPYHGDALPTELRGRVFSCLTWGFAPGGGQLRSCTPVIQRLTDHMPGQVTRSGRWRAYRTPAVVAPSPGGVQPVPTDHPRLHGDGQVRDGAWVADITGMLDLSSSQAGMRVIVRKERPHPGAPLRFTDVNGHRFTAFATDARKGQLAGLELRHRRRARCEDPDPLREGHRAAEPPAQRFRPEPAVVRDRRPGLRTPGLDPDDRPDRDRPPLGTQTAPATRLPRALLFTWKVPSTRVRTGLSTSPILPGQSNAGDLRRAGWQLLLFRDFDRVGGLASRWRLPSLLDREGVPWRLLDPLALAVAALWQEQARMSDRALRRAWSWSWPACRMPAAWSRATRMVTVKEIRSGSVSASIAAPALSAHSAW